MIASLGAGDAVRGIPTPRHGSAITLASILLLAQYVFTTENRGWTVPDTSTVSQSAGALAGPIDNSSYAKQIAGSNEHVARRDPCADTPVQQQSRR